MLFEFKFNSYYSISNDDVIWNSNLNWFQTRQFAVGQKKHTANRVVCRRPEKTHGKSAVCRRPEKAHGKSVDLTVRICRADLPCVYLRQMPWVIGPLS